MCAGTEHARLVELLTSEKDEEWQIKLQQLDTETTRRIELLQQQHSDTIKALNEGTADVIVIIKMYCILITRTCFIVMNKLVFSGWQLHKPPVLCLFL